MNFAVVTGGTDGIGKAYTIELARNGLRKFVLIGRSETKLQEMKTYLGKSSTKADEFILKHWFGKRIISSSFQYLMNEFWI